MKRREQLKGAAALAAGAFLRAAHVVEQGRSAATTRAALPMRRVLFKGTR